MTIYAMNDETALLLWFHGQLVRTMPSDSAYSIERLSVFFA